VTATFEKTAGRPDGVSYLSNNGNNQAAYGMTSDMLYGNPDPASIPALGIDVQPGSVIITDALYQGSDGLWYTNDEQYQKLLEKMNMSGQQEEEGVLTFKFDKPVTNPVLDLSGLGGFTQAHAQFPDGNNNTAYVARASFNSTDLELITPDIEMEKVASNSNLIIENNTIKVAERNTYTRAVVNNEGFIRNDVGMRSPDLEPAGSGSILLKGTFDSVSFRLYHVATPYSAFPTDEYGTESIYFWNSDWGPEYGDGVNGLNVLISEKYIIADTFIDRRQQNMDLFRASLRLEKPSSIGDFVWYDKNNNGLQDQGEEGLDGVTVKLLDENGDPAKDFNGNPIADQVTSNGGQYKFDNLAAGKYYVQVVTGDNQRITSKGQGEDRATDSDFDPETGKTDLITLEANTNLTDIDAGIIVGYKVTHEFISGTEGKELPQEVKDLTPVDQTGKKNGETVTPTQPNKTTVEVEGGKWTFVSYDRENDVIDNADQHFIGKWVFEKDNDPNPPQTKTGNVDVKYVDSKGNIIEGPNSVKKDAPVGEKYTTTPKTIPGYEYVGMHKDSDPANGNVKEGDQHVIYVYNKIEEPQEGTGNVDVRYITEDGVVLEGPIDIKKDAPAGETYTTEQKSFEGYDFVGMGNGSADAEGTVKAGETQHVIYVYKSTKPQEKTGNVYVKYVTEDGKVLEEQSIVKENAPVGEAYTTTEKTFPGYEYVGMHKDSAPANGEVIDGDLYVTYVYKAVEKPNPDPNPNPSKGYTVEKTVLENNFKNSGDILHYVVKIKNTGDLDYDKLIIKDSLVKASDMKLHESLNDDGHLEKGEVWTLTYDYVVTREDVEKGKVLNTVSVYDPERPNDSPKEDSTETLIKGSSSSGSNRPDRPERPHNNDGTSIPYKPSDSNNSSIIVKPGDNNSSSVTNPEIKNEVNVSEEGKDSTEETRDNESKDNNEDNEVITIGGSNNSSGPSSSVRSGGRTTPKTGDEFNTIFYLIAAIVSGAVLAIAGIRAKRKEN
jgi:hypothetical protein